MSRQEIPRKVVISCDRCKQQGERAMNGAFATGGGHTDKWETWAIGYDGAAGGGSSPLDLCAQCLFDFQNWMSAKEKKAEKAKLRIGIFTLSEMSNGNIFIRQDGGEGGEFKIKKIEKAITRFYDSNF